MCCILLGLAAPTPTSVFPLPPATLGVNGTSLHLVSEGELVWPLPSIPPATFAVFPSLVTQDEVKRILDIISRATLDRDPDSVDNEPTLEYYLERSGTFRGITGIKGKPDSQPLTFKARLATREKLAAIARPIMQERILPLVNQRYREACRVNGEGGQCRVCHSLIRKYSQGERVIHPTHFDIQALVTVVIPLATHGVDFQGGLYVSTGAGYGGEEAYLPLSAGDALMHQSTLLHGVNVSSGSRWSWILWLKNAPSGEACESVDHSEWTLAGAMGGDPLAQFLHAKRVKGRKEYLAWLARSAKGGFTRAANELGQALVEEGGKEKEEEGRGWLEMAAAAGEPEGLFNLGLLHIKGGKYKEAVALFLQAWERGLMVAAKNIGVAYYKGLGVETKDLDLAWMWLARAGDEDSRALAAVVKAEQEKAVKEQHIMDL